MRDFCGRNLRVGISIKIFLIGLINSTTNFHAATLWVHFGTFSFAIFGQ
jgi:hypothetical protein